MDFALSEEQEAIQEMARRFAADELAPFAAEWDEKKYRRRALIFWASIFS